MMKKTVKKKTLIVCLVFALSLLCCGLAFAAPSAQVTPAEPTSVTATINGEEVSFTASTTEENTFVSADGKQKIVLTNTTDPEVQQQALAAAASDPELQDSTLVLAFDLSYFVGDDKAELDGSVTITIKVPGLGPNDTVYALHGSDENGFADAKIIKGTNNGDGTVTFTIDGFSPFAVFVNDAADKEGASPKTGSDNTLPLCAAAVIAGLAAILYSKKQLSK